MRTLPLLFRPFLLLALLTLAGPAYAKRTDLSMPLVRSHYVLNPDGTFEATHERVVKVLTPAGRDRAGQTQLSIYPDNTRLEVVEAEVMQPDGTAVPVPADSIIARPSAVAERAPGFSKRETTTILFPRVEVGGGTRLVSREVRFKPSVIGFNELFVAPINTPVDRVEYRFDVPDGMHFAIGERGGFTITEEKRDGRRIITAVMTDLGQHEPEPSMPGAVDVMPLLVASTLRSWEELGEIYWRQSKDKAAVTPEIAALAREIAGTRTGADAVRAVYDWVAGNIRYVQVYLDHDAGYVPHSAAEVLRNRYGDCKDYVVLTQALLSALGIESRPVLVGWGGAVTRLPVPNAAQFNHAMLRVPDHDFWANPTDNRATLGTIDYGLAGRFVVVGGETGAVAEIPVPTPDTNLYHQVNRVRLLADGGFAGQGTIRVGGEQDQLIRGMLDRGQPSTVLADANLRGSPEGGLGDLRFSDPRDLSRPMLVEAEWESPGAVRMDGRVLVPVPAGIRYMNIGDLHGYRTRDTRDFPLMMRNGRYLFETRIVLPEGWRVVWLPKDETLENDVGGYRARYRAEGGEVVVERELVLNRPVVPAAGYGALMELARRAGQDHRAQFEIARTP